MADVPTWDVFAYRNDDEDGSLDERRRGVPEWRLQDVIRWATSRGYDNIYLSRSPDTTVFKRTHVGGVRHHVGD